MKLHNFSFNIFCYDSNVSSGDVYALTWDNGRVGKLFLGVGGETAEIITSFSLNVERSEIVEAFERAV